MGQALGNSEAWFCSTYVLEDGTHLLHSAESPVENSPLASILPQSPTIWNASQLLLFIQAHRLC